MSTWITTIDISNPLPVAATLEQRDDGLNLHRVAIVAAVLSVLFILSDHDWFISQYEEFSETSDFMEQASAEGNVLRKAAIFLLGAASAAAVFWRGGYTLHIRSVTGALIIAAATWCIASWLWAIEPGIAARRLIASGCVAMAALAAARWLSPRELAAVALAGATTFLALGGLVEIALGTWQPWRGDYRFAGTLHPNAQGLGCAVLVMAAVELARQSRRWRTMLCALAAAGFIGLWLTKSRTPLAALIGAEVGFWFLVSPAKVKLIGGLAAIWAICVALLVIGPTVAEHAFDAAMLGRDDNEQVASLTGRVPLWEELSDSIERRPLHGYGFNSFWTSDQIDEISESQSWAISVAHSTYLDLTLGIGLIGAGLWVVVVAMGLLSAARRQVSSPSIGFAFIGVLLTFGLLHGVLESAFANPGFVPLLALAGLSMLAFIDPNDYEPVAIGGGLA
jgi:exopolysaccharide production protein ExoQ